jgi:RNA polymerase sigma-70 factor (ECF subfamily)
VPESGLSWKAQEEEAWVRAAAQGDAVAFARLYDHFAPMVHGVLLARIPRQDVEDLMQDVFVTAMARLSDLREPSAFGGWLAAIARNKAADHYRAARGTPELLSEIEVPSSDREADLRSALAAIRNLPEAYRETLILRFVEGLTGPEIAARTGLKPDSVRVNLCRGVKLLRKQLGLGGADD